MLPELFEPRLPRSATDVLAAVAVKVSYLLLKIGDLKKKIHVGLSQIVKKLLSSVYLCVSQFHLLSEVLHLLLHLLHLLLVHRVLHPGPEVVELPRDGLAILEQVLLALSGLLDRDHNVHLLVDPVADAVAGAGQTDRGLPEESCFLLHAFKFDKYRLPGR